MGFEWAYVPIGVPTFHLESAEIEFKKSVEMLKGLDENVKVPQKMLLTLDDLNEFLNTVNPKLIILQNITFANAAYASEVIKKFNCPIMIWTLREPVIDGGRLRLNSLTGAFSSGNMLYTNGRSFEYVFGSPNEESVVNSIKAMLTAAKIKEALINLTLLQVGHTPQGFGFGRANDAEILNAFGVTLQSIEARELIDIAKATSDDDAKEYLEKAGKKIKGLEKINMQNQIDFAKLYKAYAEYCKNNNIGALASRCWPDFFTSYGTPVCSVLAMLNDEGIAAACEADAYGALTMFIAMKMTMRPVFFGDPVSMDEKENTITFWHCGTAATALARNDTGACAGLHCNRKIGPTLEFGCKEFEEASVLRVGKDNNGTFRIFVTDGEIINKPQQFNGTSLVFKANGNASKIVTGAVKDGWEPHFVVSYGNISKEIEMLGNMLGIDVWEY